MPKTARTTNSFYKLKKKSRLSLSSIAAIAFFLIIVPLSLGIVYMAVINPRAATPGSFGAPTGLNDKKIRVVEIRYFPEGTTYDAGDIAAKTEELRKSIVRASRLKGTGTPQISDVEIVATVNRYQLTPSGADKDRSPYWHDSLNKILDNKYDLPGGKSVCNMIHDPANRIDQVWIWKDVDREIELKAVPGWDQEFQWTYPSSFPREQFQYSICDAPRSFIAYSFNMGREAGASMHAIAHSLEHQVSTFQGDDLLWKKWAGSTAPSGQYPGAWRTTICGSVHYPPNGTPRTEQTGYAEGDYNSGYDYGNYTSVQSACDNWKPDGTLTKVPVTCKNWNCDTDPDPQRAYMEWWMQRMPQASQGFKYNNKVIPTWWDFMYDLERNIACMQKNGNHLNPEVAGYTTPYTCPVGTTPTTPPASGSPTPTPTFTPSPTPSPDSEVPQTGYQYIIERRDGTKPNYTWTEVGRLDPSLPTTTRQVINWQGTSRKFRLRISSSEVIQQAAFRIRVPGVDPFRYRDKTDPFTTLTMPKKSGDYQIRVNLKYGTQVLQNKTFNFKFNN